MTQKALTANTPAFEGPASEPAGRQSGIAGDAVSHLSEQLHPAPRPPPQAEVSRPPQARQHGSASQPEPWFQCNG